MHAKFNRRIFMYNSLMKTYDTAQEGVFGQPMMDNFLTKTLLKVNLLPLGNFIEAHRAERVILPEYFHMPEGLDYLLNDRISGVLHEITQWHFDQQPYCLAFQGWRVGQFPQVDYRGIYEIGDPVLHPMLMARHGGGMAVTVDQLEALYQKLDQTFDVVGGEIDRGVMKDWHVRAVATLVPFEGMREGLPGRLTPEFVAARLALLRAFAVNHEADLLDAQAPSE